MSNTRRQWPKRKGWAIQRAEAARSGIGLLFTPKTATYEERMWQRAYDAAIALGAPTEIAQREADDAAIRAKATQLPLPFVGLADDAPDLTDIPLPDSSDANTSIT